MGPLCLWQCFGDRWFLCDFWWLLMSFLVGNGEPSPYCNKIPTKSPLWFLIQCAGLWWQSREASFSASSTGSAGSGHHDHPSSLPQNKDILILKVLSFLTGPITMFTHFRMRDGMPLWQAVTSSGTASYCWSLQLKTNRYIRKGFQGPGVGQLHSEDEGPGNGVNNLEN